MERKTCNGLLTCPIKASIKQTRINKLGKYPYNKNKDHIIQLPADQLLPEVQTKVSQ